MELNGLELARGYYEGVVSPLLAARWPGLPHAGARLGSGSDVLGLDDATSRDHDWGLRLTVLVGRDLVTPVDDYLARALPSTFRGLPTRFPTTWDPVTRHRVEVDTVAGFAASRLGIGVTRPWSSLDWLALTGQSLLEVTAGAVFADTDGALTDIRRRLAWYPDDVWAYVIAAHWCRLGQELPLVGRAGMRGDDPGSRLLAARLVGVAMHLGFALDRRWPPYPKWLGTRFALLPSAGAVAPALGAALRASGWRAREAALCAALEQLHELQRSIGLPTGEACLEPFFERPFRAVRATVHQLLLATVADPHLRALPAGLGSVEQWVDNVDVLAHPERRVAAMQAWRSLASMPTTSRDPVPEP